jgi:hypothetical protein
LGYILIKAAQATRSSAQVHLSLQSSKRKFFTGKEKNIVAINIVAKKCLDRDITMYFFRKNRHHYVVQESSNARAISVSKNHTPYVP